MATLFAVAVESYLCTLLGAGQVQSSDSSQSVVADPLTRAV